MYLKCELPDGYFRLFDDISDLVIPKERIMVTFPPPPENLKEGQCHGICVWDAVDCLSTGGQHAISHLVGSRDECFNEPNINFIVNPRAVDKSTELGHSASSEDSKPMWQRYPHHQMLVFRDKNGDTVVFVTQYPVYVCNDEGKTMEKIK